MTKKQKHTLVNCSFKTPIRSLFDFQELLKSLPTNEVRAMGYQAAMEPPSVLTALVMQELDSREVLDQAA